LRSPSRRRRFSWSRSARPRRCSASPSRPRRALWQGFAGWILLSLEFALGADIIRTAISPTWDDIGKLAVIAAVRTALNYFLAHDLEDAIEMNQPTD